VFPGGGNPLAGMTTLEIVLGRRPSFEVTVAALAEGFRAVHGLTLEPGGLTDAELALADTLARDKYGSSDWTRTGRMATLL
jgi:lipoate-protein ligase A